jgi:alpha-acetolactate decarboxylase
MYDPDTYTKGDFKVIAKGASGLIAKEQLQLRRNEFLTATGNQIDMQIIGMEGRAYLLREVARTLQMDTDKLVPDVEVIKFKQEQMAQAQMMMQAAQAQQMPQSPQGNQLPSPTTLDEAGNPAGGGDANTMNGVMQ